jgi:Fe-S-cluster containining protein
MAIQAVLCVRCAGQGKTCCQGSEVYVTLPDVGRIGRQTASTGFCGFASPSNPAYSDQSHDPVWQAHVFRRGGRRRVLKQKPSGDCVFLGASGCLLPVETRPLVCRLYPYCYTAEGIGAEFDSGCPISLLAPGELLIDALHMSLDKAREWHRMLYEEILFDGDDDWPDLRLAV